MKLCKLEASHITFTFIVIMWTLIVYLYQVVLSGEIMPCENSKKNLRISAEFCMTSFRAHFSFETEMSSTSSNPFSISQLEVRSTVCIHKPIPETPKLFQPKKISLGIRE